MPKVIPPSIQQVTGVLKSLVINTQDLLTMDPRNGIKLRTTFIYFFFKPAIQLILGFPFLQPPHTNSSINQTQSELSDIKSTILTLLKAVANL